MILGPAPHTFYMFTRYSVKNTHCFNSFYALC